MGIQFPSIAFLYLLYLFIYVFFFYLFIYFFYIIHIFVQWYKALLNLNLRRPARVREVTEVKESSCEEARALPSLQGVAKEFVASRKLLAEYLQKQQQLLPEHIRNQQSALEREQQNITQLMSHSQNMWQPGCFACGDRKHFQRDCPGNGNRNQRGGPNSNRENRKQPPLKEKTPRQ